MEAYARVDFSSDDIKRFFIPLEGVLLGLSVFAGTYLMFYDAEADRVLIVC